MEKLLTNKELCEWLQISTVTAYKWRKQGMPYIGHHHGMRFNPENVQKWLENRSKKAE